MIKTYEEKLQDIANQLAVIQNKAVGIGQQGQELALGQNKPTVAAQLGQTTAAISNIIPTQIKPTTILPNTTLGYAELASELPTSDLDAFKASQKVIARTNNLAVDAEPPETLTAADYFGQNATDLLKQLQDQALDRKSQTALLQEQYDKFGVGETFDELKNIQTTALSIRSEIDKVNLQRQADLGRTEERPANSQILVLEQNKVNREADRRIATLATDLAATAAAGAMIQGNLTMAQGFANQFVQASTYDAEKSWKDLVWMFDTYQDMYSDMKDYEKKAWDDIQEKARLDYEDAKTDAAAKGKLMTDPDLAGAFIGMDVNEMTLEEMYTLAQSHLYLKRTRADEAEIPVVGQKTKYVSIKTPSGYASIPVDVNNVSSETIQKLRSSGVDDASIYSWLDTNTDLTASSIKGLLEGGEEAPAGVWGGMSADELYDSLGAGIY